VRWLSTDPAVPTPLLSLAAFARVTVPADGSRTVSLFIEPRAFAVLTDPQCGVVPSQPGKSLTGPPYVIPPPSFVRCMFEHTHTHELMHARTHARTQGTTNRPSAQTPARPPKRPHGRSPTRSLTRTHARTHTHSHTPIHSHHGWTPGTK
jgi:hypothetical protein